MYTTSFLHSFGEHMWLPHSNKYGVKKGSAYLRLTLYHNDLLVGWIDYLLDCMYHEDA
jgi:hypothetical protein